MNRGILFALVGGILLAGSSFVIAADAPALDVPRLPGINVDGSPGDWGSNGFRIDTLAGIDGTVKLPADLDANVRLGWDDAGLLVLLSVRDDRFVESPKIDQLWRKDCVELYLAPKRGSREIVQPVVAPGLDPNFPELRYFVHDSRRSEKLKKVATHLDASRRPLYRDQRVVGYVMEVRIPWDMLGIEPQVGTPAAFQVYVDDADDPNGDYGKTFHDIWYPAYGAHQNSFVMYALRLAEKAGPPVRAAARLAQVTSDGATVRVIGPADLAGTVVAMDANGWVVARGKLAEKAGRAVAELTAAPPRVGQKYLGLPILADGQAIATLDQAVLPPPAPAEGEQFFGGRIQRTMSLLATSTHNRAFPVRILLYGQSIVDSDWHKDFEAWLRKTYPYADLDFQCRAIGGIGADKLVYTAEHDVYPFYPDLVLFHCYGGEDTDTLERILANIRRNTTAEIVVFTHHAPTRNTYFDNNSQVWRLMCQKYNVELIEVRKEWLQYIEDNGLEPSDLLRDDVHPNDAGNRLMAQLVERHFRWQTLLPGGWYNTVRTYEVGRIGDNDSSDSMRFMGRPWPRYIGNVKQVGLTAYAVGTAPNSALVLPFVGNRVDLDAGWCKGPLGTARVLIDAQPPSKDPNCYAITLPTPVPGSWFPAVLRVAHHAPLLLEDWTLRILEVDVPHKRFRYEVSGSVTGPDGEGWSNEQFVSKSGRAVIGADTFMFPIGRDYLGKAAAPGVTARWKVVPMYQDTYAPSEPGPQRPDGPTRPLRVTVAQGLTNGPHTLTLIPNGDGPVPVRYVIIHRPPME